MNIVNNFQTGDCEFCQSISINETKNIAVMSNASNSTPAKKMRRESYQNGRSTPESLRSLHIDFEETEPSPAASSVREDEHEDLVEQFWRDSGIECAANIASKLASSAVRLAARHTLREIALEKRAAAFRRPGRVGWPGSYASGVMTNPALVNIPAVWRASPTVPRLSQAMATPPRQPKRKPEAEWYPDILGIAPLSPKSDLAMNDKFQGELAALARIERKARLGRAEARRQRIRERAQKRKPVVVEEEDTESDELPELVPYHDCDQNGCVSEDSSDEDNKPPPSSQNATVGHLNVVVNVN